MADFFPKRDSDVGPWLTNLTTKVGAAPANYGVVAGDVTPVTTALTAWNADYPAHIAGQAQAQSLKQAKDATLRTATAAARTLVRKMQGSGQVSAAEAADLQIGVRDTEPTPVGPPVDTPLIHLDFHERNRCIIHFGPNPQDERNNGLPAGAVGVTIRYFEGGAPPADEADWLWLANDSNPPYTHNVGGTTPRTFTYQCAYINRKNQQGPWSAPQTATVTP